MLTSPLERRIVAFLHARPMMAVELAARIDYSYLEIRRTLAAMVERGDVRRIEQRYALPVQTEECPPAA
jgi:DNA-binding IclR family transcriptional regulator